MAKQQGEKLQTEINNLKAEAKKLDQKLDELEKALKAAETDLEQKTRLFLVQRDNLRFAEQKERESQELLREQERKVGVEISHLDKCRREEREAQNLEVQLEAEVARVEMLLEIADSALTAAHIALTVAIAAAAATLGIAVAGIVVAQGVVSLCKNALSSAKTSVQEKKATLKERKAEHKKATERRQKSERDLQDYRITVETRKGELRAQQTALAESRNQFDEKKNQMDNAATKSVAIREERTVMIRSKETKMGEIRIKEDEISKNRNTMNVAQMNINQSNDQLKESERNRQRLDGEKHLEQVEVQSQQGKLNEKQKIVENQRTDVKNQRTKIEETQQMIDGFEEKLTDKLHEQNDQRNTMANVRSEMEMKTMSLDALHLQMIDGKSALKRVQEEKEVVEKQLTNAQEEFTTTAQQYQTEFKRQDELRNKMDKQHQSIVDEQTNQATSKFQTRQMKNELRRVTNQVRTWEKLDKSLQNSFESKRKETDRVKEYLEPVMNEIGDRGKHTTELKENLRAAADRINALEKDEKQIIKERQNAQKFYDAASNQREGYLTNVTTDFTNQDQLQVCIVDNQRNLNKCDLEIREIDEMKSFRQKLKTLYKHKQNKYPDDAKVRADLGLETSNTNTNVQTNGVTYSQSAPQQPAPRR